MTAGGIAGRRVVVVGASAGIGRAFAVQAGGAGADVVLAGRRVGALTDAAAEAGAGTPLALDVCDAASRDAFTTTVAEGPPVDLVLVCVGVADLRPLARTDEDGWTATLATNLVGVARLVDGLLPALAPTGIVAVLSSESARLPRTGLVPYAASKAALEVVLHGLRLEHPGLRVSCAVVGATQPTEFGAAFAVEDLMPAMADWQRRGLFQEEFMATDDVAGLLLGLYATALRHPGVGVEEIVLRSPSPVLGTPATEERP